MSQRPCSIPRRPGVSSDAAEISIEINSEGQDVGPLNLDHMGRIAGGIAVCIYPEIRAGRIASPTDIVCKAVVYRSSGLGIDIRCKKLPLVGKSFVEEQLQTPVFAVRIEGDVGIALFDVFQNVLVLSWIHLLVDGELLVVQLRHGDAHGLPVCFEVCPIRNFSLERNVEVVIGDRKFEYALMDHDRCAIVGMGLHPSVLGPEENVIPKKVDFDATVELAAKRPPVYALEGMVFGRGHFCGLCLLRCPVGSPKLVDDIMKGKEKLYS